jgi:hypothetical protein
MTGLHFDFHPHSQKLPNAAQQLACIRRANIRLGDHQSRRSKE